MYNTAVVFFVPTLDRRLFEVCGIDAAALDAAGLPPWEVDQPKLYRVVPLAPSPYQPGTVTAPKLFQTAASGSVTPGGASGKLLRNPGTHY